MKSRSQSRRLQIFDDCHDGLYLTGIFSILRVFCKHMIGIIVISAEDILVALGGWDNKPTGGISVNFPRCFMTGKLEIGSWLFDRRRVIT